MLISIKMETKKKGMEEKMDIPHGVDVKLDHMKIRIHKSGMNSVINYRGTNVELSGSQILMKTGKSTKKDLRLLNSLKAHIKNAFEGFEKKYVYKLQICAVHFPMNVAFDKTKRELVIKNFLGGKVPRISKILPGVDVKVDKEVVILESHNKEAVGQSAANIEASTRITNRDRRVFQDGVWMTEKAGVVI